MLTNYFAKITLFTVLTFAALLALIITAISRQAEEIKSLLMYRLAVATAILFVTDFVLKRIFKHRTGWLWTVQIFLLLIAVYIWIIS